MKNFIFVLEVGCIGIIIELGMLIGMESIAANPTDISSYVIPVLTVILAICFAKTYRIKWSSRA